MELFYLIPILIVDYQHIGLNDIITKFVLIIFSSLDQKCVYLGIQCYLDHVHPLFVQCLKFFDIVKLKTLIIIYKAKTNMLPINLQFFL